MAAKAALVLILKSFFPLQHYSSSILWNALKSNRLVKITVSQWETLSVSLALCKAYRNAFSRYSSVAVITGKGPDTMHTRALFSTVEFNIKKQCFDPFSEHIIP